MSTDTSPTLPPTNRIDFTRWVAVVSLFGLIALGLSWELWLAPLREGGSWWALKVLPLCIPIAGLLKNRMYTYRWMSLLIWVYFTEGVVRAWSDKGLSAGLALGQTMLCLSLFVAVALHVRWRFQTARAHALANPQLDDSGDGTTTTTTTTGSQ